MSQSALSDSEIADWFLAQARIAADLEAVAWDYSGLQAAIEAKRTEWARIRQKAAEMGLSPEQIRHYEDLYGG